MVGCSGSLVDHVEKQSASQFQNQNQSWVKL